MAILEKDKLLATIAKREARKNEKSRKEREEREAAFNKAIERLKSHKQQAIDFAETMLFLKENNMYCGLELPLYVYDNEGAIYIEDAYQYGSVIYYPHKDKICWESSGIRELDSNDYTNIEEFVDRLSDSLIVLREYLDNLE